MKGANKEANIERQLVMLIRKAGGRAYKFKSPGNSGVPDRIVVLPGGRVWFVELKTDEGEVRPLQRRQLDYLRGLNCNVRVLYGQQEVYDFIEEIKSHAI